MTIWLHALVENHVHAVALHVFHYNFSRTHLHRYMDQFAFVYNTRTLNDGERTTALIRKTDGKRLRYRDPVQTDAA